MHALVAMLMHACRNPCFYKSAFEHFTPRFIEKADEMLDGIRDELSMGAAHFDIFAWSERLFYDSMCDVGFGYKAGILKSNDKPPILELFDFIYVSCCQLSIQTVSDLRCATAGRGKGSAVPTGGPQQSTDKPKQEVSGCCC